MVEENIKHKALSSAIWKVMERVLAQGISLVVSLILARLLSPDDYGIVGIVTIFFTFANILIAGGLSTALIQKKKIDKLDYSTIFVASLGMALVIYGLLFGFAPMISRAYEIPLLVPVIRIMGLILPIYAIKSVFCAYISRNLQFRTFFFATLGGTLFSAVLGITMALSGCGVWSLVAQQMSNAAIDTLILFLVTRLTFRLRFSWSRFKDMFRYAYKILISGFLGQIYVQTIPMFIGYRYSSAQLSYYTKGKMFPATVSSVVTESLASVLFPVLSRNQDRKDVLLRYTRIFMQMSSFIIFPAMLGLMAVSDKLIVFLLTDRWLEAAYFMRVFCISIMFDIVAIGNCETIKAMGRSDIYLKLEIIKKAGYYLTIILFLIFCRSPRQLVLSEVVCTLISILVNCAPNQKLIGYSFKNQVSDLLPSLVNAGLMCLAVLLVGRLQFSLPVVLLLQIVTGVVVYTVLSFLDNRKSCRYALNVIQGYLGGKK